MYLKMQKYRAVWHAVQQHRVLSLALGHICVLLVLVVLLFGSGWGTSIRGVFARAACAPGDTVYRVVPGDTLGGIAGRYSANWQHLAAYNHIPAPYTIYSGENVCIPARTTRQPVRGQGNFFPYGQCTWWANQRYHALHGIYVPWTSQSNAWQWTDRAYQFSWNVSSRPSPGAIIDLQPWVQGAYGLGHVAVVERVLGNGHVIASNMNWGAHPSRITYVEFSPGSGVTFITF